MANLEISTVCNLSCPFCFAADHMAEQRAERTLRFIDMATFERHLDFLDRSSVDSVRFIGGEPTLHPRFPELIRRARARRKQIVVFTHGLIPHEALTTLAALSPDDCTLLVNANASTAAGTLDPLLEARRFEAVRRLGTRAFPGFTIYRAGFDLTPLLDFIDATGCRRAIRLGLAQPILNGVNAYVHPKQYRVVATRVMAFARQAVRRGVQLEFDCGFVRCMFAPEEMAWLLANEISLEFRCSPVLDLSVSGRAAHCFPLAGAVDTRITAASTASQLRLDLDSQRRAFRVAGVYRECSTCHFKQHDLCTGGCLAQTLRRFQQRPFSITLPNEPSAAVPGD